VTGDLLITGIGELVTNRPGADDLVGVIRDAAVAINRGSVVWVGPEAELPGAHRELPGLDAEGRAALPGFVDSHTHMVFAGDRSDEFARRLRGETYAEILAAGGGIHSTVEATRAASTDELQAGASALAMRLLHNGTTTVEIKSGYGLDVSTEVRLLEVANRVGEETPLDVITTFLGAHVVARGMERSQYLDLVIDEMLPVCAPLSRYCDVFCDEEAFSVDETRTILRAAAGHGLGARIHAEQLVHTGATRLAAEVGAASADHLDHATREDAALLQKAGTVAVLLPGVSFSMRTPHPPARMLWDSGVTVALATDCNPGSSYVENMPLVAALAALEMGLTPEEATWAATRGGALALEQSDRGWLGDGAIGDLVLLDAPSHLHLAYRPGADLVWRVVKGGTLIE
jgi:imidazolonepropionase